MYSEIDFYADMISVSDIFERVEELEDEIQGNIDDRESVPVELTKELEVLKTLLEELESYGGDEQWRGDWYPNYLINESHFSAYVQEMLEDSLGLDVPWYVTIDWDDTASNIRCDYGEVYLEDGPTFLFQCC